MRILSLTLENFASYDHLHIEFDKKGLTLISGPNGAGKSTVCDGIAWVLYGRTAKNGAADEVVPWGTEKTTTSGTLSFAAKDAVFNITRTRNPTDLFICKGEGPPNRGANLLETQGTISLLVNAELETFLSAAYFHELSPTTTFFSTTPKIRRAICEQLVDLTLAKSVQAKAAETRKSIPLKDLQAKLTSTEAQLTLVSNSESARLKRYSEWEAARDNKRIQLAERHVDFEEVQHKLIKQLEQKEKAYTAQQDAKVAHLTSKLDAVHSCPECGSPRVQTEVEKDKILREIEQIWRTHNPYTEQIQREKARSSDYHNQINALDAQKNPYEDTLTPDTGDLKEQYSALSEELTALTEQHSDLIMLEEVLEAYRQSAVKGTISMLEQQTNAYLDTHFDAEMRIQLTLLPGEKIETEITKDGNYCSYTQLSKGQRRVLNLCFGVAVMRRLAEAGGFTPSVLCFDEALDGMDDLMKQKAFSLLSSIEQYYDTILVVDHSEAFKTSFLRRYSVELINGRSVLSEEARNA